MIGHHKKHNLKEEIRAKTHDIVDYVRASSDVLYSIEVTDGNNNNTITEKKLPKINFLFIILPPYAY